MRLLVLGGTVFVGRAIVEQALREGHDVTLFHRGRTGADLFPGAARRIGDRDTGDYAALADGEWDAVVDVSGYVPRHVGQAMDALGDRVGRYVFVSSHAVYVREGAPEWGDETTPRRTPVRDTEELSDATYGPLKAACEDDVVARFGDRATIVRAGKVVGPGDAAGTFAYWVRRGARGGRVAVPGDPGQPLQVLDVRDLGAFVVRLVRDGRGGVFHAVGPAEPLTLGGLVETAAHVAGTQVELVQVPVAAAPPHFPLVRADRAGQRRSAARARAAGLPATPIGATVADVLAWDRDRGEPPLGCGFATAEDEQRVLAGLSREGLRRV